MRSLPSVTLIAWLSLLLFSCPPPGPVTVFHETFHAYHPAEWYLLASAPSRGVVDDGGEQCAADSRGRRLPGV
jgi:hypothetical protein